MYKVSIEHLKAFKDALVKSNQLLKMIGAEGETDEFDVVIDENEKQIEIITNKFYVK